MKFRTIPRPFGSLIFQYLPCGRPPPEYRHRTYVVRSITRLGQQARREADESSRGRIEGDPCGERVVLSIQQSGPPCFRKGFALAYHEKTPLQQDIKAHCIHCHSLGALFAGGLIEVRDKVFPLSCRAGWWWMESSTSPTVIFLRHLQSPVDDYQTPNNRHLQPL